MQKLRRAVGWTLALVLVLGLVLRLTAFDVWTVPDDLYLGASTAPTLAAGDTVVLLRRGTPGFGDLVKCPDPKDPTLVVIGRIAGVAGDVVEVEGPALWVNGRSYQGESACAEPVQLVKHPETLKDVEVRCDIVQMGGGWHYRASARSLFTEQKKTATVGPGKVFLVSDNRTMHDDSRDFGLVDAATCVERPVLRLWGKAGWSDDKTRFTFLH